MREYVYLICRGTFLHPKDKEGHEEEYIFINFKTFFKEAYREWNGQLGLFGGAMESHDESPYLALAREIEEEISTSTLDQLRLSPIYYFDSAQEADRKFYFYICQVNMDQATLKQLSSTCDEGAVVPFSKAMLAEKSPEDFSWLCFKNVINNTFDYKF